MQLGWCESIVLTQLHPYREFVLPICRELTLETSVVLRLAIVSPLTKFFTLSKLPLPVG